MAEENKRMTADANGGVKVRLYGQGLGDCFLFAFPRKKGEGTAKDKGEDRPCYMVIDCGVAMSTPDKGARIRQVVRDIAEATGGRIDVLALTHQHYDHISAFCDAPEEWSKIQLDALYLPWTERTAEEGEHSGKNDFRDILERATKKALEKAEDLGILDATPGFRAQADFVGAALAETATGEKEKDPPPMDEAMTFARRLCKGNVHYFEPGDVFRVPGTDFHGYVLGPPRRDRLYTYVDDKGRTRNIPYIELLVQDDPDVMYSYGSPLNLPVDDGKPGGSTAFSLSDDRSLPALASGLLAADAVADARFRDADDQFCPFASEIRLDWDNAMASPFFQTHYGDKEPRGESGAWRRVDNDWLVGSAALALRAGDFTNNISLVLAFDIPDSQKMLLFPGDAQVGNWLSWHTITGWNAIEDAKPDNAPQPTDNRSLMENLLGRVAFYKVGHHGSHNATIRAKGLEMMTRDDLTAFIPVSVSVAQDYMGYCPMPFYPVIKALQTRTQGRVFLPSGHAVGPGREDEAAHDKLRKDASIVKASAMLPAIPGKKDENGVPGIAEDAYPLYLEVTIQPTEEEQKRAKEKK